LHLIFEPHPTRGHRGLWPQLNHKILDVALLRLRFCSIAASKSDSILSAILPNLFLLDSLAADPGKISPVSRSESFCERRPCPNLAGPPFVRENLLCSALCRPVESKVGPGLFPPRKSGLILFRRVGRKTKKQRRKWRWRRWRKCVSMEIYMPVCLGICLS
jgi:hypothetical protein